MFDKQARYTHTDTQTCERATTLRLISTHTDVAMFRLVHRLPNNRTPLAKILRTDDKAKVLSAQIILS